MQLARQYDRVRLENACRRAIEIGSPTRTSVQSILKKGLDRVDSNVDKNNEHTPTNHDNVRGPDYYNQEETQH